MVYVAVNAVLFDAPGAKLAKEPFTVTSGSSTVISYKVISPVFVTVNW